MSDAKAVHPQSGEISAPAKAPLAKTRKADNNKNDPREHKRRRTKSFENTTAEAIQQQQQQRTEPKPSADARAPTEESWDEYVCPLSEHEQLQKLRAFETFLEFRLKFYVDHLCQQQQQQQHQTRQ